MRLRQSIVTPDRFDDVVFNPKRRDPTKPQYPELLAQQTTPFDPQHTSAAFPTLPLWSTVDRRNEATSSCPTGNPSVVIEATASAAIFRTSHTMSLATETGTDGLKEVESCPSIDRKSYSDGDDTCATCKKKVRTSWQSLPLSVQIHIFNSLLCQQRYSEAVATSLQLTCEELEDVKYQLNLRKIFQVSSEDIWQYGAAVSRLGPNIIDPATIGSLMDYLIFASRYEVADEKEIKRGRTFLKELGLDNKIMDGFACYTEVEQLLQAGNANFQRSQTRLKRNRNSAHDRLTIDVAKADVLGRHAYQAATAPANITTFRDAAHEEVETKVLKSRARLSLSPGEAAPNFDTSAEIKPHIKRLRLNIDTDGYASIAQDACNNICTNSDTVHRTNDLATIDDLLNTSSTLQTKPVVHRNHRPRAFAPHFGHITFPPAERERLLRQDPKTMVNLDHWLVYGTAWTSLHHTVEFGVVPKPIDHTFNPRKTILDGNELQSCVLRALVGLHNSWIDGKQWEKTACKETTRYFNLTAETVMEKALQLQIPVPKGCDSMTISQKDAVQSTTLDKPASLQHINMEVEQNRKDSTADNNGFMNKTLVLADRNKKRSCSVAVAAVQPDKKQSDLERLAPHQKMGVSPVQSFCSNTRLALSPSLIAENNHVQSHEKKQLSPPGLLAPPRKTPKHRDIQQHTGDTTIDVLGNTTTGDRSTDLPIDPGVTRRKLFKSEDLEPAPVTVNTECNLNSNCNTVTKTEMHHTVSEKAPTQSLPSEAPKYSPISDQESDSLPAWGRYPRFHTWIPETSCLSSHTISPKARFERPKASRIQGNTFLQEIIDAAAENVIGDRNTLGVALTSGELPYPTERCLPLSLDHELAIGSTDSSHVESNPKVLSQQNIEQLLASKSNPTAKHLTTLEDSSEESTTAIGQDGEPKTPSEGRTTASAIGMQAHPKPVKIHFPVASTLQLDNSTQFTKRLLIVPYQRKNVTAKRPSGQQFGTDPTQNLETITPPFDLDTETNGKRTNLSLGPIPYTEGSTSRNAAPEPLPPSQLPIKVMMKQASQPVSKNQIIPKESTIRVPRTTSRRKEPTQPDPTIESTPARTRSSNTVPARSTPSTKKPCKDVGVKRKAYKKKVSIASDSPRTSNTSTAANTGVNATVLKVSIA